METIGDLQAAQRGQCERLGHDWWPRNLEPLQHLPVWQVCLRCMGEQTLLPTGMCPGGHPIAEHYDEAGDEVPHPSCTRFAP